MIVGASGDQSVATSEELLSQSLSIGKNLLLIGFKLGCGHCHHVRSDGANFLIVWSTLQAWENCIVDLLRDVAVVFL